MNLLSKAIGRLDRLYSLSAPYSNQLGSQLPLLNVYLKDVKLQEFRV